MPSYRFIAENLTHSPSSCTEGWATYSMTSNHPVQYSIYMHYNMQKYSATCDAEPNPERLTQLALKHWPGLQPCTLTFSSLPESSITQEAETESEAIASVYHYFILTSANPASEVRWIFLCVGQEEQNGKLMWAVYDSYTEDNEWRLILTAEREGSDAELCPSLDRMQRLFTEHPAGKSYLTIMYPVIYPDPSPALLSTLHLYKTQDTDDAEDTLVRDPAAYQVLTVAVPPESLLGQPPVASFLPRCDFSPGKKSPLFSPKKMPRTATAASRRTLPRTPLHTEHSPLSSPSRLPPLSVSSLTTEWEEPPCSTSVQAFLFPDSPRDMLHDTESKRVNLPSEPASCAFSTPDPLLDSSLLPRTLPPVLSQTEKTEKKEAHSKRVFLRNSLETENTWAPPGPQNPRMGYALLGGVTVLLASGVGVIIAANLLIGSAAPLWLVAGIGLGALGLICPFLGISLLGAACVVALMAGYYYGSRNQSDTSFPLSADKPSFFSSPMHADPLSKQADTVPTRFSLRNSEG